ncbi:hypothetical protein [Moorena sp. SIO3I6]|nr:hypothetical protein [Moorena sp. SIO3I6]NEP26792.1 hypothetical protein [Moorena sp. SIO3I6]
MENILEKEKRSVVSRQPSAVSLFDQDLPTDSMCRVGKTLPTLQVADS